jgi:hypothetical protein
MWVKQCHLHHPPVISIFIGGMFTIPSHGWFMTLLYAHYSQFFFFQSWGGRPFFFAGDEEESPGQMRPCGAVTHLEMVNTQ